MNDIAPVPKLVDYLNQLLVGQNYFAVLFGSYASGTPSQISDVDFFVAMNDYSPEVFRALKTFVINLHTELGIPLDEEVPFENKLLVSYKDLDEAVQLTPFKAKVGYTVSPIAKTIEFLSSHEMRLRLLLNALTTPNQFLSGNEEVYNTYRRSAEEAMTELAKHLVTTKNPTLEDYIQALSKSPAGDSSELYLGYKIEKQAVQDHVRSILKIYATT